MQNLLKLKLCHIYLLYPVILMWCIITIIVIVYVTKDEDIEIESISKRAVESISATPDVVHNISCHYLNEEDALPSAEDPSFSPNNESMFFLDTMCLGELSMLQACAAESAAKAHPKRQIYVLFSSSVSNESLNKGYLAELLQYTNVKVARIHLTEYSKGTLVESIVADSLKTSEHPIEDISNILRVVTLNKWGGIFLENDMIVFRSLDMLPKNWVAKQDKGVSSRILAFAKDEIGRNITNEIIKEISETYDPKYWQHNGQDAVTRVLKRICPEVLTSERTNCKGLKVFARDLFYPIQYTNSMLYLDDSDADVGDLDIPYTYHHLLKILEYNSAQMDEDWPFAQLGSHFCPYVYTRSLSL